MIYYGNEMTLLACIKNKLGIDVVLHQDGQFHHYPVSEELIFNRPYWIKLSEDGRSAHFGNFFIDENYSWYLDSSAESENTEHKQEIVLLELSIVKIDQVQKLYDDLRVTAPAEAQANCQGECDYDL